MDHVSIGLHRHALLIVRHLRRSDVKGTPGICCISDVHLVGFQKRLQSASTSQVQDLIRIDSGALIG